MHSGRMCGIIIAVGRSSVKRKDVRCNKENESEIIMKDNKKNAVPEEVSSIPELSQKYYDILTVSCSADEYDELLCRWMNGKLNTEVYYKIVKILYDKYPEKMKLLIGKAFSDRNNRVIDLGSYYDLPEHTRKRYNFHIIDTENDICLNTNRELNYMDIKLKWLYSYLNKD